MSQARIRNFYYHSLRSNIISQTQPDGSLAHSIIQDVADDQRHIMIGGNARHVCPHCGKEFGRSQEMRRHIRDRHEGKRRCPFCKFMWSRPETIKFHLVSKHAEMFSPEILQSLRGLRGLRALELVVADADACYPIKTMIISTGCDDFYFVG